MESNAVLQEMKSTVLAAFLCFLNNATISLDNMEKVAKSSGGKLNLHLAKLLQDNEDQVKKWFAPFHSNPEVAKLALKTSTSVLSSASTPSSSSLSPEEMTPDAYEKLKEKY